MPETTNVVEVDFRRRPSDPLVDAFESAYASLERSADARELAVVLVEELQWYGTQLLAERHRRRKLEKELLEERVLNFPFSDEEVGRALRRVYSGVPLSATEVATALRRGRLTHSIRIRTGLVLSRLARAGLVTALPPATSHETTRWLPPADEGGAAQAS